MGGKPIRVIKTHDHEKVWNNSSRVPLFVFISRKADQADSESHWGDRELEALMVMHNRVHTACIADIQRYESFIELPEREIESYSRLFGLSEQAKKDVFVHMKFWSILRQCCGSQASQDELLALHTSNLSLNRSLNFKHALVDYDYPACETYRLDEVEKLLFQTKLAQLFPESVVVEYHPWRSSQPIKPGWCKAERQRMFESGLGFNGALLDCSKETLEKMGKCNTTKSAGG